MFDPAGSFLDIRIGGLAGKPLQGNAQATGRAVLTGGAGSEVIAEAGMGMGQPNLFQSFQFSPGANFFTGTPNITDLFLTVQNGTGTFTQGGTRGSFQGNTFCAAGCFGGTAPLKGQSVVEILGFLNAPVPLSAVGAGGTATSFIGAIPATIIVEGAQWGTGSVQITNIATNIISITSGPRAGQTGIGFTLQVTTHEDSVPTPSGENGVTVVTVAGTTSFSPTTPATGTAGVNQVALISPVHINVSDLTNNPPIPGLAVQVLRYVPEPGTMLLLGSAVAGLLVVGRKRMKR
ncbi:MAG: PEP-CTERM sorting domain-containing protein [Myxococcota bacterium]